MVLNGDILEYEGVGQVTQGGDLNDGQVPVLDVEAINLLITFFEFVWANYYPRVESLRGGGAFNSMYQLVGPKPADWIMRHVFTKKYREGIQMYRDNDVREAVRTHQKRSADGALYRGSAKRIARHIQTLKSSMWQGPLTRDRYYQQTASSLRWQDMVNRGRKSRIYRAIKNVAAMDIYYTIHKYNCDPHFNVVTVGTPTVYCWKFSLGTSNGLWSKRDDTNGTGTVGTTAWSPGITYNSIVTPNFGGTTTGVNAAQMPNNANIMLFVVDWPFFTMNYIKATQVSASLENIMRWKDMAATYTQTTDPIYPIQFSQIAANKDWTTIYHLGTEILMDFINYSIEDQNVEILLFKWIVDHDTIQSYQQQIMASCSGYRDYDDYLLGQNSIGTPQIRVVKKIRFKLTGALDEKVTRIYNPGVSEAINYGCTVGDLPSNRKVKKLRIKRKYAMKRPVEETAFATSFSELGMFNELYEAQQGIYCKITAWPTNKRRDINIQDIFSSTPVYSSTTNTSINASADIPSAVTKNGQPRMCVGLTMTKKSFIKLDKTMMRGPFMSDNA